MHEIQIVSFALPKKEDWHQNVKPACFDTHDFFASFSMLLMHKYQA